MPIAVAILVLDVMFVWHAAKTGRASPWAYVILALPGVGALAYLAVEIVPAWLNSYNGRQAQMRVTYALNPEKRYRELANALDIADTVANRGALANECLTIGKFEEARAHFDTILKHPMGDDAVYAIGKARAEFGLERPWLTIATLDALQARCSDFQSPDAHMLYARALEASGQEDAALNEYQALSEYHSGAEARVRMGQLLDKLGRHAEARVAYAEVVAVMQRQPKFTRKVQAEWIAQAEKALRG